MALTITGIDELTARINITHQSSPRTLDLAMNDTADAIMLKAMKEVPVLTGTLRQSIGTDLSQTLHKIIFASADYASKIEYGEPEGGDPATQDERADPPGPRPFMRPAFQTEKKRINEFYEKRKG
tara:strand:+ start:130 stop:504 length:375 start_codon:yes stop_codon:yes gene_type:complete